MSDMTRETEEEARAEAELRTGELMKYLALGSWVACGVAYLVVPPLGVMLHLWAAVTSVVAWRWALSSSSRRLLVMDEPVSQTPAPALREAPRCQYCFNELTGSSCDICGAPKHTPIGSES